MKEDLLRQAIGGIDDVLIEASEITPEKNGADVVRTRGIVLIAASLAVAALFALVLLPGLLGNGSPYGSSVPPADPIFADTESKTGTASDGETTRTPETTMTGKSVDATSNDDIPVTTAVPGTEVPVVTTDLTAVPPPDTTSDPGGPGTPNAVLTRLDVGYEEAVARFGHPILKCEREDFLGYQIGVMSRQGDISSPEAVCIEVVYVFRGGTLVIYDQTRTVGKPSAVEAARYEYAGRTFLVDRDWLDGGRARLLYWPGGENYETPVYIAVFDGSTGPDEIMELIVSLEY